MTGFTQLHISKSNIGKHLKHVSADITSLIVMFILQNIKIIFEKSISNCIPRLPCFYPPVCALTATNYNRRSLAYVDRNSFYSNKQLILGFTKYGRLQMFYNNLGDLKLVFTKARKQVQCIELAIRGNLYGDFVKASVPHKRESLIRVYPGVINGVSIGNLRENLSKELNHLLRYPIAQTVCLKWWILYAFGCREAFEERVVYENFVSHLPGPPFYHFSSDGTFCRGKPSGQRLHVEDVPRIIFRYIDNKTKIKYPFAVKIPYTWTIKKVIFIHDPFDHQNNRMALKHKNTSIQPLFFKNGKMCKLYTRNKKKERKRKFKF